MTHQKTQGWAVLGPVGSQGHTGTCTCESGQLISLPPPHTYTHIPVEQHRLTHHHRWQSRRPPALGHTPPYPALPWPQAHTPPCLSRHGTRWGNHRSPCSEKRPAWAVPSTQLTPPVSPSRHSKAGQCWRCGPLCWSSYQCWMPPSQTWGPPRGGVGCCWGLSASWARISRSDPVSGNQAPGAPPHQLQATSQEGSSPAGALGQGTESPPQG